MRSVYKRAEGVIARCILDEVLLVRVTGRLADLQEVLSLNETGALIWEQLDGTADLEAVAQVVAAAFDVSTEDAERDVADFLGALEQDGLVVKRAGA